MIDTKTPSPSDAEIESAWADATGSSMLPYPDDMLAFARAVLARWGQPQAVAGGEPVAWMWQHDETGRTGFVDCWQVENGWQAANPRLKLVRQLYTAPPPQAVREQTPIRRAALELYTPPFRHEHGYIRDANHQMVADDASSEATELIAARIRGWGRIQYMDKPEMRANALQDEVAEVVAEALNVYWAAHGITKGGQHGPA